MARLSGAFLLIGLSCLGCAPPRVKALRRPLPTLPPPQAAIEWQESFETLDPERWRHIKVHGATTYRIVELDGRRCLLAESSGGASILLTVVSIDPRVSPWLSWTWRVDQPIAGEALEHRSGSDASARVYVYFETPGLPWQKRNLDYVWSTALPVGTSMSSAFTSQSHILVVTAGAPSIGRWETVERQLVEDYRRAFGGEPPRVVAIGVMNDTDDTGSAATAYFDDVRISRAPFHPQAAASSAYTATEE